MAQKDLLSVIEHLLEADVSQNKVNKDNQTDDQDDLKISSAVEADKEVTPDELKDEGGTKGSNASDASASIDADEGPHSQGGDKMETPMKDASDVKKKSVKETAQDPANAKSQVDKQEKQKTSPEVQANKKDHKQASDAIETPTKANPKGSISEAEVELTITVDTDDLQAAITDGGETDIEGEEPEIDGQEVAPDGEEVPPQGGEVPPAQPSVKVMAGKPEAPAPEMGDDEEGDDVDQDGMPDAQEPDSNGDGQHDQQDHEVDADQDGTPDEDDDDEDDEEEDDEKKKGNPFQKEEKELTPKQKKLDVDGDGDIGSDDLAALRAGKKAKAEACDKMKEEDKMEEMDGLEEDFKQKATIIFETAVNEKVKVVRNQLTEKFQAQLDEQVATINEKVSEYVDFAVQEWLKENQLEIKYSLRTEISENFIRGLKGLFEDNYIEIPEEDVSVVDELTEAVESFKEQLEEKEQALEEALVELLSIKRKEVFEEVAEGLTETQKIRLEKLSESVEATDVDEFRFKVEQLKESFFDGASDSTLLGSLSEEVFGSAPSQQLDEDSPVSQYAKFLSKTVLK